MIKQLLEKLRRRKEMKEEYESEDRIVEGIQQRKKSGNERELESYLHEERERMILNKLKQYRKKRDNEYWHGKSLLVNNKGLIKAPPLFKGKNIFK